MRRCIAAIAAFIVVSWVGACNEQPADDNRETQIKGTINISVDETFKPVIAEQIKVYEATYPEARIIASYKSEADCFRDFQKDSTRMIIVARGLNQTETSFFKNKLGYNAQYDLLAFDAIAVIVNKSSNDSVFTIEQLSSYLSGKDDRRIVLDGTNATSTVRYLMDSLLKGKPFGKNVQAAQSSEGVIDLVAGSKDAIGMVGVSWVSDPDNPKQRAYLEKIKLAYVECRSCGDGAFYKPTQAGIAAGKYSLYRGLYYALKENTTGLGSGFLGFMKFERGQLIFKRAYLVPAKMGFNNRLTNISSD
ncbi:MAG: phosphate transporter substrate-binding protein PhoT family [Chitinophagaceae bacterium]|jgi:phosphate transport system substrate-binding protein|nr:phosphate transporter substrate-binding protein PhoT family [Chitinophagaceae bacterium]